MKAERGGASKYARIAGVLRSQIISGDLEPGDRVPSEPEITEQWGVSKTTAARALALLEAEGLIERRTGAGSFVTLPPEMRTIEVGPGTRITARPDDEADIPGLPPGTPVLVIQRPGIPPERYRADTTTVLVTS